MGVQVGAGINSSSDSKWVAIVSVAEADGILTSTGSSSTVKVMEARRGGSSTAEGPLALAGGISGLV